MTLLEIQAALLNEEPLRVRGLLRKRTESMREFLIEFLTNWNHNKETIFVNSDETQTEPGKRRSIGDIYRVIKYYYRKATLKEIKDTLIELFPEGSEEDEQIINNFRSSKCSTIHKRVYYSEEDEPTPGVFDKTSTDEYGYTWAQWEAL